MLNITKKKHVLPLILAVTILFGMMATSCQRVEESEKESNTESGETENKNIVDTGKLDDGVEYTEDQLRVLAAYEPSSEGAFVLNDDVVYSQKTIAKYGNDFRYLSFNDAYPMGYIDPSDSTQREVFCQVEGCDHKLPWCVSYSNLGNTNTLAVEPESEDELIFYGAQNMPQMLDLDNNGSEEFRLYSGSGECAVFEYNMKTHTRRTVASFINTRLDRCEFYYNGKLYCSAEPTDHDKPMASVCIDVATGEYTSFDYPNAARPIGIIDGKVYIITEDGIVFGCEPDLSGREVVCDLSVDFISETLQEGGSYRQPLNFGNTPMSANGILIYKEIDTLKMIDLLHPDEGPAVITDNVLNMGESGGFCYYDGNIYFASSDDIGYVTVGEIERSYTDTMYRYDMATGEIETVFDGLITDINDFRYADDEKVVFEGRNIAMYTGSVEYEFTESFLIYEYTFDTGVLRSQPRY